MNLLKKRVTIVQSIALMAIMAAINVVVSLIAGFSVVASTFLIIILPLTSAIVEISCKEKYFPIYALATIGLSIVTTLWNIDITLFYVVPSIITGFIFGFITRRSIHYTWGIIIAALVQTIISLAFIPLLNFIFQIDFIGNLLKIFKITNQQIGNILIIVALFLIALIQVVLSAAVVSNEIKKFQNNENQDYIDYKLFNGVGAIVGLLTIPFAFLALPVAYLVALISFYFGVLSVVQTITEKKLPIIVFSGAISIITVFLVAIFYSKLPQYSGLLLFAIAPTCICIVSFCFYFLKKEKN